MSLVVSNLTFSIGQDQMHKSEKFMLKIITLNSNFSTIFKPSSTQGGKPISSS